MLSGPAGSGKTTTIYACLRELAARARAASLATLEDPVEAVVPGVAQAQVNLAAGLTLEIGPQVPPATRPGSDRHRRDPRSGDRRDRPAGRTHGPPDPHDLSCRQRLRGDRQAARYGDRAVRRAKRTARVVAQRLSDGCARARCPLLHRTSSWACPFDPWVPSGCEHCRGTGYRGRTVLAEFLLPEHDASPGRYSREQTFAISSNWRRSGNGKSLGACVRRRGGGVDVARGSAPGSGRGHSLFERPQGRPGPRAGAGLTTSDICAEISVPHL